MTRSGSVVGHVLLVEDDPGDAFLVAELLAEVDPELAVTVAATVDDAVGHVASATACCST